MPLLKNVAGQKIAVFAYDVAAGAGKTGDQANITAQISKDFGVSAALTDVNPVELDAVNHPGWYVFDLDQAETNADCIIITVSSTTAGIRFAPLVIYPTVYDATKAGYLDGAISVRALEATLTAIKGGGWTNETLKAIKDFVDDLEGRLTSARAGYLDNLSAGAVAQQAVLLKVLKYISNKMVVVDANGNYTVYDDDGVTPIVTGNIADDTVNTIRSEPSWV